MRARPELRKKILASVSAVTVVAVLAVLYALASRAELRFVNTHEEPLTVILDGKRKLSLSTVATETPDSGTSIRLSAGTHHLRTETPGGLVVDDMDLRVEAFTSYLVAPGHTDQCFFVEHTAYGAAKPRLEPLRELPREERIWALPEIVDAWFVPNPPPSADDKRSSGGVRTAIRQARCGFLPWH
jgi:hypothetical protein